MTTAKRTYKGKIGWISFTGASLLMVVLAASLGFLFAGWLFMLLFGVVHSIFPSVPAIGLMLATGLFFLLNLVVGMFQKN